ncbi:RNA-binding protein [Saccharothrix hoggarensis]|uniref:RNA-binding protein n=1 Tax=Saccharothrix hoggarensis TaxID=913853 RepID=A0ABW3QL73_9PSEU
MNETAEWERVKSRLPMGAEVRGTVLVHAPFGIFVDLAEAPGANAVLDGIDYRPGGEPVGPDGWPPKGAPIEAVVVDHVDENRQLKLRVGPSWWDTGAP